MKKLVLTIVLLQFIIFLNSCNKELNEFDNQKINQTENSVKKVVPNPLTLPVNTKVIRVDKHSFIFKFPKNIELLEIDDNNNVLNRLSSMGYTCSCSNGGGGCNPFTARGKYGCLDDSCGATCSGSHSNPKTKEKLNSDNLYFIDNSMGIEPITLKEYNMLPYMPEKIIKYLEKPLKEYAKKIYGDKYLSILNKIDKGLITKSDIDNEVLVIMKGYGYKFVYSIDTNELDNNLLYENDFFMISGHSCNCDSGSEGCTKASAFGVKYCKAGSCNSCTISTIK